jgi:hypothetical protein
VEAGECFKEDFEMVALGGRRYVPVATLHDVEGGISVVQVRLRVSGRPGFGLWYTYDCNEGCCCMNPNGLHRRHLGSLLSCIFVGEDAISTSNSFCAPLVPADFKEKPMDSLTDCGGLCGRFSVDTFSLKSAPQSNWLDCGLVAMHSVFSSQRLRVEVGSHVVVQFEETFKNLEALWDAAIIGECSLDSHVAVLKAVTEMMSASAVSTGTLTNLRSAHCSQNAFDFLQFLVRTSGRLSLSCVDWMFPCEAAGCRGGRMSCERQNDMDLVDIPPLVAPLSEATTVNLGEVVASFFDKTAPNFLGTRLSVVDLSKGLELWKEPTSMRCLHPRRRWLCPVGSAADMPAAFVVVNRDARLNKERGLKITYVVGDEPIDIKGKNVRYMATSAVVELEDHFVCQVRTEDPKASFGWWTYDGMVNDGRITRNDEGAFQGSECVIAVVFTKVDEAP